MNFGTDHLKKNLTDPLAYRIASSAVLLLPVAIFAIAIPIYRYTAGYSHFTLLDLLPLLLLLLIVFLFGLATIFENLRRRREGRNRFYVPSRYGASLDLENYHLAQFCGAWYMLFPVLCVFLFRS